MVKSFKEFLDTSVSETYNTKVRNCKLIYLDTNYWIKIGDAYKRNDQEGIYLLQKLIQLVESGDFLVPISDINYYEILKQKDENSLNEIASLMRILSKNVCTIPKEHRERLEVNTAVRNIIKKQNIIIKEHCWMPFNAETLIQMRKEEDPFVYKDNIDVLNELKEKNKGKHIEYEDILRSELFGLLEFFEKLVNECMDEMFYENGGKVIPVDKEQIYKDKRESLFSFLVSPNSRTMFPTFYIFAELFSMAQWNKDRKYKDGNDTIDYLHASVALPYFDYFFTERELAAVLRQRKIDAAYSCIVESKSSRVLEILGGL